MRENKQVYADVEKLSSDNERSKLATLSPAEREQVKEYFLFRVGLM
jgi:hypothetical protein